MAEEHFLDAAVIIGRILSWDAQRRSVQAYFDRTKTARHTSEHVSKGVRSTLLAIRRSFREYAVQLDRDINGMDTTRIEDQLHRHLSTYLEARLRAGTLTPNLAGQVRSIAQFFRHKFRNASYGSGKAEDAAFEVDAAMSKALNDLALLCQPTLGAPVRVHACPHDVRSQHAPIHGAVHAIMGGHADDSLVAIEAYHIQKSIVNPMIVLVTTDRAHFLSNKEAIDKVLAPVRVEHPDAA